MQMGKTIAVDVVRKIFEWRADGWSLLEIGRQFQKSKCWSHYDFFLLLLLLWFFFYFFMNIRVLLTSAKTVICSPVFVLFFVCLRFLTAGVKLNKL